MRRTVLKSASFLARSRMQHSSLAANTTRPLVQVVTQCRWLVSKSSDGSSNTEEDLEEWIPPNHPLPGDRGQSHLHVSIQDESDVVVDEEEELRRIEQALERMDVAEKERTTRSTAHGDSVADWTLSRREALSGMDMMKPADAAARRQELAELPVRQHMLLSKDEIVQVLTALGSRDVAIVLDDRNKPRMGGSIGIIIATANNSTQSRMIANELVRQMRLRKLDDVGVEGAKMGVEGSNDSDENWFIVDCSNYTVHLQNEKARKAIDLEGLWTGKDGLHQLNIVDDDAVEDYVAANPVPEDYGLLSVDWDETVKQLQKSKWTIPHKPVVPKKKTKRRRS